MNFYNIMMFAAVLIQLLLGADGLIGYDCRHAKIETTVIDAITVEKCRRSTNTVKVETKRIQLLQRDPQLEIPIYQCHISVTLDITRCGMWSHQVHVRNPHHTFIVELTLDQCREILETKRYSYAGQTIATDIDPGVNRVYTKYLAGNVQGDGTCRGAYFTYGDMGYEEAVVLGTFKVMFNNHIGHVDLIKSEIHIPKLSSVCDYKKYKCLTPDHGLLLWDHSLDGKECEQKQYEVLYSGIANFTEKKGGIRVVSLATEDLIFSLMVHNEKLLCSHLGYTTEHPRLFIIETVEDHNPFKLKSNSTLNTNLISYINTKIVFVERLLTSNLESLYDDVTQQKCELERNVIMNQLTLAYLSEDEFAYNLKQEPGYSASVRGEVIHLIKCVPVDVMLDRRNTLCYNEATVSYLNETYYLSPRNRILKKIGKEFECNHLIPVIYKLTDNEWFSLYPMPQTVRPPIVLDPNPNKTWSYTSVHGLAVAGIYSLAEVEALQHQMMFSGEKEALDETMIRRLAGEKVTIKFGDTMNLFTETQIRGFFQKSYTRLLGYFTFVGDFTSGILGLFVIGKIFLMLFDWLMNYLMLKEAFGSCSKYSFMFCCNALTAYYINRRKPDFSNAQIKEGEELKEVGTTEPLLGQNVNPPPIVKAPIKKNRAKLPPIYPVLE